MKKCAGITTMKQVITWTCDSVGAAVYFFIKQFLSAVEGVNGVIFMGGQWQEAVGMEKDGTESERIVSDLRHILGGING